MKDFIEKLKNIRKQIKKVEKIMSNDGDGCYEVLEKQYIELVELSKIFFKDEYKDDLKKLLENHTSDRCYSLNLYM